jgi:hypothetical protein
MVATLNSRMTRQSCSQLAKLMIPTEETIQWMDDYHIPEDAIQDISRHHNAVVGHHGVQKTIARLLRERTRARSAICRLRGTQSSSPYRFTEKRMNAGHPRGGSPHRGHHSHLRDNYFHDPSMAKDARTRHTICTTMRMLSENVLPESTDNHSSLYGHSACAIYAHKHRPHWTAPRE